MTKYFLFLCVFSFCSPKVEVQSFKEQLEYAGIKDGTTYVNYQIELSNPKEDSLQIVGVWAKGKWLKYTQTASSEKTISIYVSDIWQNPKVDSTSAPSRDDAHKGVVKYHVTGKRKIRYAGIEIVERLEPLSRP